MSEVRRPLNFDAGIERVMSPQDWQPLGLPENVRGLTSEAPVDQRLAEVLYPPSAEQALLASCRPEVHQADVLTPTGYQSALDAARGALAEALARTGGGPDRDKLEAAAKLLEEETALRDLLHTYRHLLQRA
jgi:hypothetical protein